MCAGNEAEGWGLSPLGFVDVFASLFENFPLTQSSFPGKFPQNAFCGLSGAKPGTCKRSLIVAHGV